MVERGYSWKDFCYCMLILLNSNRLVVIVVFFWRLWWRWWWKGTMWRTFVIRKGSWPWSISVVIKWCWRVPRPGRFACCRGLTCVKFGMWSRVTIILLTMIMNVLPVLFVIGMPLMTFLSFCRPWPHMSNLDPMFILTGLSLGNILLLNSHPFHTLSFGLIWKATAVVPERSWHFY